MRLQSLPVVFLWILGARACAGAQEPPARPVLSIDLELEEVRQRRKQPAMAAAVVRGDRIAALGAAGFRRLGSEEKVRPEDRFHLGSCTKSMTASVIAILVEEGKLGWTTTIAQGLPEIAGAIHPDFKRVTLTQLLTHHAGVAPYTHPSAAEWKLMEELKGSAAEERREFAAKVLKEPPLAPPGSKMVYSNAGYGVAAALAERAAGEPWESLLEKRFFGPLGMRSAGFGWPATVEGPDQPWGHSGSPPVPQPPDAPYRLPACLAPAGGVHASIEDFARYARFHLQELRGRKLFLEPATARLLHTPVGGYAMGWMDREVAGRKATWHNGSAGTFFAWMSLWPELDLAVVVVTSAGDGEPACEEATVALARRFFPGGAEARPPAAPAGK